MANHRNRVTLNCAECGELFEIIKCRLSKSVRHFCSADCRSKFVGRSKRLNKYPKIIGKCKQCGGEIIAKYQAMDKPHRVFCSYGCNTLFRNLTNNPIHKSGAIEKLRETRKSTPVDAYKWDIKRRIEWAKRLAGENSHFWLGGLTSKNRRDRNSSKYRIWREAVFKRDSYTCQVCNTRGGYLNADHIMPWAMFPKLRYRVGNGRTLCPQCHYQTDSFGFKAAINYRTL